MEIIDQMSHYINSFRFTTDLPLGGWIYPTAGCIIYLALLYFLKYYMRDRKPFTLHTVTLYHNVFLSVISLAMFAGLAHGIFLAWEKGGFWGAYCNPGTTGPIAFWSYVFYCSKYYEWTDTILLSLKKKELLPLHVYHHCITLWISYGQLITDSINFYEPLLTNCMIHTFMYYYYARRTVGKTVWWKRYLTMGQLVQFVVDIVTSLHKFYLVYYGVCQGSYRACIFGQFGIISFFFLFVDFYKKTYNKEEGSSHKSHGKKEE